MDKTAYDRVRAARANDRPTGKDYIDHLLTDFFELHGDRRFADDPAIVAGVGYLCGRPVTAAAVEKGHGTRERLARNFGSPGPDGYRKALRLARQAEKFGRPVLLIADTAGAYCGVEAEERGQGEAIAENLTEFMALRVPVVTLLVGEGGSGGALALAVADRVWMLENAWYSVISPEGCASILWKDASKAAEASESLRLTAEDALRFGSIDEILPEEGLGKDEFYAALAEKLAGVFAELSKKTPDELTAARWARWRALGVPQEGETHA